MIRKTTGLVLCIGCLLWSFSPVYSKIVNRIAAKVNDELITFFELSQTAVPLLERLKNTHKGETLKKKIAEAELYVLNQMIDMKLLEQQARKFGITVSEQDVERQVEQIRRRQNITLDELELALSREGLTLEEYRGELKKRILSTRYVEQLVRKRVKVNEEKLKSFYTQNKHQFRKEGGDMVRVADIFLAYSDVSSEGIENTDQKADNILQKLKGGADFGDMARKYSEGPTAMDGGSLGFLNISEMQYQFREVLSKLKPGEVSEVIKSPRGIHLLKLVEQVEPKSAPFQEIKNEVYNSFMAKEQEKVMKTIASELRENAFIEIML